MVAESARAQPGAIRRVYGPQILDAIVEEICRVGQKPLARLCGVPSRTICKRVAEPQHMRLGEFLRIIEAIGASAELAVLTPPPGQLQRRYGRAPRRRPPTQPAQPGEQQPRA